MDRGVDSFPPIDYCSSRAGLGVGLMQSKIWLRLRLEDFQLACRELVRRQIRKLVEIAISDLDLMDSLRELGSSVDFERKSLSDVPHFKKRPQLFRFALDRAPQAGLFMEFGVYKGDGINRLAELKPDATWYGFDSFTGLPEAWRLGARQGAFDVGGVLPPVQPNVKLVPGYFDASLQPFLAAHQDETIAFMHIDCDLYGSTKTVLDLVASRMVAGTVILFDEFFNYAGWQEGEYRAFNEFCAQHNVKFDYLGYVRTGGQLAVQIRSIGTG
jgi:Macrocin-O-methyltransferase (TylF)